MREYRYRGNILYVKCNRCWKFKILEDFYKAKNKRWGIYPFCKTCTIKIVDKYRKTHKYWRNSYQQKQQQDFNEKYGFNGRSFHKKTCRFVDKYNLRPKRCPICWSKKNIQIHHPLYNSFDDRHKIVFCCCQCHHDIHHQKIKCPTYTDLYLINKNDR